MKAQLARLNRKLKLRAGADSWRFFASIGDVAYSLFYCSLQLRKRSSERRLLLEIAPTYRGTLIGVTLIVVRFSLIAHVRRSQPHGR